MVDVNWRWSTTDPPAAPVYVFQVADEASPPDPDAVIVEDTRVSFEDLTVTKALHMDPAADLFAGDISADKDMEFLNNGEGPIVPDKTTGIKYRIIVDNGVLKKEAV